MEKKLIVTMKDLQKYKGLKDLIDRKINGKEASDGLGLSYVHISRLKNKLLKYGFEGLLKKSPASPPNKKINQNLFVLKNNARLITTILLKFRGRTFQIPSSSFKHSFSKFYYHHLPFA